MINLAFGLLALYLIIIVIIYGVQKSWSDTFYTTGQKIYFTLTFMSVMFLLMEGVKPNPWFIMGAFFLGLVGVAANFRAKNWMAEGVHMASVYFSIGCFVVGFAIINIFIGLSVLSLMALSVYLLRNVKNSTWWRETAIAIIIFLTLKLLNYA